MRNSRPVEPAKQLERLERKHEILKARVRELEGHPYLTTLEQVECNRLKKKKLATKDALSNLREALPPPA